MRRRKIKTKREELLEIVDSQNKPLGAMPRSEVHRQKLIHRSVLVLLYNKEKKLYLQQRSYKKDKYPGFWDLSASGHILAGESAEDAAIRELKEELGIELNRLKFVHKISASSETDNEFIYLFSTGLCSQIPIPNKKEVIRGIFVNKKELEYLINTFPSSLTPGIVFFWKLGLLFSPITF